MPANEGDGDKKVIVRRNFPLHSLEEALAVPQKIQDEMAGRGQVLKVL